MHGYNHDGIVRSPLTLNTFLFEYKII